MELNKIERLVKKYFDGETSVEEREKAASTDVASHLMQYKSILVFISCGCGEYQQELAACQSCSIKRISYGYQLLLQFFALERWDVCVC
jgi:hypothetical protein